MTEFKILSGKNAHLPHSNIFADISTSCSSIEFNIEFYSETHVHEGGCISYIQIEEFVSNLKRTFGGFMDFHMATPLYIKCKVKLCLF